MGVRDPLLLDGMSQFMGQQFSSGIGGGGVLPRAKNDMTAHGVGQGVDGASGVGGLGIRVNPYLAEIVPETGFHEGPGGGI